MNERRDDICYPVELVKAALGERVVFELSAAAPEPWCNLGFHFEDRFVVNAGAVGLWLFMHFGLNVFSPEADNCYELDPLSELIQIRGQLYRIPHWCYLNTGLQPEDERPRHWPGIPAPTDTSCEVG